MSEGSLFSRVPVIDVHNDNFLEVWPSLVLSIKSATFIGMDLELSGLGNRKTLNAKVMDERYRGMADVARTRSVLSLGLSCFKLNDVFRAEQGTSPGKHPPSPGSSRNEWKFLVQTFNILVLCTEDFIVEPITLKFLVDHGFDFNKQYDKGISYYRGNDQTSDKSSQSLRQLFSLLVLSKSPVVFHNALVDLVFLYQSFFANLPPTVAAFVSDLTEIFEGGVYDTKYITEYIERLPASYLEYVFRRCQRSSSRLARDVKHVVSLEFLDYPSSYTYVRYSQCELPTSMVEKGDAADGARLRKILCHQYASFGWCPGGSNCFKSHDIDLIIDLDALKPASTSRKRKRRQRNRQLRALANSTDQNNEGDESLNTSCENQHQDEGGAEDISDEECKKARVASPVETNSGHDALANMVESNDCNLSNDTRSQDSYTENYVVSGKSNDLVAARSEGHRAGYDAFMTGYIMACCITKYGKLPAEKRRNLKLSDLNMQDLEDRVYLCGKDIPLVLTKSAFAKTSKDHREKMEKIQSAASS